MKLEGATHDCCAHGVPLLLDGVHLTYGWSRCSLEANSARPRVRAVTERSLPDGRQAEVKKNPANHNGWRGLFRKVLL